jgi:Family of unknown function (DUF6328)
MGWLIGKESAAGFGNTGLEEARVEGRNETHLERCDRNLTELLQEVRVVQTGVQVLFAFLLMAPLTPGFADLGALQRLEYFVTLTLAGAAALLLIAPTAYHRVLFRLGDKDYLVTVANRLTIAGLAAVALSMVGAFVFVTDILFGQLAAMVAGAATGTTTLILWAALPLARRRALAGTGPARRDAPTGPDARGASESSALSATSTPYAG